MSLMTQVVMLMKEGRRWRWRGWKKAKRSNNGASGSHSWLRNRKRIPEARGLQCEHLGPLNQDKRGYWRLLYLSHTSGEVSDALDINSGCLTAFKTHHVVLPVAARPPSR